jgi:hypothetical protein
MFDSRQGGKVETTFESLMSNDATNVASLNFLFAKTLVQWFSVMPHC